MSVKLLSLISTRYSCSNFPVGPAAVAALAGCVPGGVGSVLKISDARGKTHHQRNRHVPLPYPTFVPVEGKVYPLVLNRVDKKQDPFAYPEIPIYDKDEA